MKKQFLSLLAGLMLGGISQIKAMNSQQNGNQSYITAALAEEDLGTRQTDQTRLVVACAKIIDGVPGIGVYLETLGAYDDFLQAQEITSATLLTFCPLIKPRTTESIAMYVARVETQKRILLRKYVRSVLQEEPSAIDEKE